MSNMMEIYLVYDYKGPNGYIPFYYTKTNLSSILDKNQNNIITYNKFSPSTKQILTKFLWNQKSNIPYNLYLVLIDVSQKNEPIENILSDTLNLLIKTYPDNIKIIYFEHEVTMHSLF